MEVRIHQLLEALEDSSVAMEEENVVSATKIKELTAMKINSRDKKTRPDWKRATSLALAAVLVMFMGMAVYAAGEIFEYRKIKADPELSQQSDRGAEDIRRFVGEDIALSPTEDALYLDNEAGQSGVTGFRYKVEESTALVEVQYYDSGEIYAMDVRELYPLDYEPHDFPIRYLEEKYPDRAAYRQRLIEAAPGLIDKLHEGGWIKHGSEDIYKADILEIHVFSDGYSEIRVLTKDDNGYELWLHPDTFELEGFMYWNQEDTQVMRNGFFPALKEDRLEQWWAELMANSVG